MALFIESPCGGNRIPAAVRRHDTAPSPRPVARRSHRLSACDGETRNQQYTYESVPSPSLTGKNVQRSAPSRTRLIVLTERPSVRPSVHRTHEPRRPARSHAIDHVISRPPPHVIDDDSPRAARRVRSVRQLTAANGERLPARRPERYLLIRASARTPDRNSATKTRTSGLLIDACGV